MAIDKGISDIRLENAIEAVKRILNCIPSREAERDWLFEHATAAGLLVAAPPALPESTDLRESWWKVGDQGVTGSCVGWATADSVIRWHLVKKGVISTDRLLSTRFIWMAAKETDKFVTAPTTFIEQEGTSLKAALDIVRKYGVVEESVLPFNTGILYPRDAKSFYALAARLKISSYFNLSRYFNLDPSLTKWRTWLAFKGPILTRLEVDETWDRATLTKGNLDEYKPDTRRGGHAVALVGYTKDRFIVRNSWGTYWGDNGFAHASVPYAQAAFTEAYGVSI